MSADVAEIARGLTKAQREALVDQSLNGHLLSDGFALRRMGLIRGSCSAQNNWKLTLLKRGLAVRAHLLTQEQPR